MKNKRKVFDSEMKRIMEHIVTTGDIPDLDDYGHECLYQCCEDKYVVGVVTARMASGKVVCDIQRPRVLKAGLDFCYPKTPFEAKVNISLAIISIISTAVAIIQTARL